MKASRIVTSMAVVITLTALPAMAAVSPHSQAVNDGTLSHGAKHHESSQNAAAEPDSTVSNSLSGRGLSSYPRPGTAQDKAKTAKTPYPLDTCIVLGNKLGDNAVDHTYNGRHVRFCCKGCIAGFEKDPQKYLSKLDAAEAKAKPEAGAQSGSPTESSSAHCRRHE